MGIMLFDRVIMLGVYRYIRVASVYETAQSIRKVHVHGVSHFAWLVCFLYASR